MELAKEPEKKERTLQDINHDYTQYCFLFGDREYKMRTMKQEMENAQIKMKELDEEARILSMAKKSAAVAPAPEAPTIPPEPVA